MVQIQFPDGAVRPYEKGITALGIAKSISEGLAKKVLAASVNGEVYDATRPIETDAALKLLTWNSKFWVLINTFGVIGTLPSACYSSTC